MNYCMIFEGQAVIGAEIVNSESIRIILANILDSQDRQTLSDEFPKILHTIRDDPDNNFEVIISTTAQKLTLYNKKSLHKPFYRDTAVKSIGIIIANSHGCHLEYD